jgi:O-antigen/teichoic acid export membrane protein
MPPTRSGRPALRRGVAWNVASLAVLAASGVVLNAVIARVYDAAALGAFNQVWAVYVFFSMAAAGGLNLSVLRSVAAHAADRETASAVVLGALVPAVLLSAAVAALFWAARGAVAARLSSDAVRLGMEAATPGLFFFALNKLLLGVVNGLQRMRAFAVYQALRYLLLCAGLGLAVLLAVPGARLPAVLSFAEGLLFLALAVEVSRHVPWWRARRWAGWARAHTLYGAKAALSGMLLELNSRVDILMLGLFLGDAEVGVYSFAALFAEGFFQLVVVLQNNYNPIIAELVARGRLAELEAFARRGRARTQGLMALAGLALVLAYPLATGLLTGRPEFQAGRGAFALLVGGVVLSAGYLPFQGTLLMAGRPGWHTLFMLLAVLVNAAGNGVLIPRLGLEGAAAATALALLVSALLLVAMVRRLVGLRL